MSQLMAASSSADASAAVSRLAPGRSACSIACRYRDAWRERMRTAWAALHAVAVSRLIVGGIFVDRQHARRVVQFRPLDFGVRRFWIAEPTGNSRSIVA